MLICDSNGNRTESNVESNRIQTKHRGNESQSKATSPQMVAATAESDRDRIAATVAVVGPSLVMKTPLRNFILDMATQELGLRVRCDSASTAWWSPIRLRGINVHDQAGQLIGTATQINTQRSLAQLIANPTEFGNIQIDAL